LAQICAANRTCAYLEMDLSDNVSDTTLFYNKDKSPKVVGVNLGTYLGKTLNFGEITATSSLWVNGTDSESGDEYRWDAWLVNKID